MSINVNNLQAKNPYQNRLQQQCFDWFQKALLTATGVKFPIAIDTVYCHAWLGENSDQVICNCKLVTRDLVEQSGGTWLLLHDNICGTKTLQEYKLCNFKQPQLNMKNDLVIESFIHKKNAVITALETCINILSVGLIIYKK